MQQQQLPSEDFDTLLSEKEIREKLRGSFRAYKERRKKFCLKFQPANDPGGERIDVHDDFLDFFLLQYNNIFTEAPPVQSKFLNLLHSNLTTEVKPKPFPLYSDILTKRVRKATENKSYPSITRDTLCKQFFRRLSTLKQQKYKTMQRYSHFCNTSAQESYAELYVQDRMKVIDDEMAALEQRYHRLKSDNYFSDAMNNEAKKPKVAYEVDGFTRFNENPDPDTTASDMTKDDIMCYLRNVLYQRKLTRPLKKLSYEFKWIHYTKRFEILREANDQMNSLRVQGEMNFKEIVDMNRNIIIDYLVQEEKKDQAWVFFLGELFYVFEDETYPSLSNRRDYPPFIDTNRFEIQKTLDHHAKKVGVDLTESSNMQTFIYKITSIFKILFENQVALFPSNKEEILKKGEFMDILSKNNENEGDNPITLLDKIVLEQENIKRILRDRKLMRDPVKYREVPCNWLKELIFERDVPASEKLYYQTLNLIQNKDTYLKNMIDLTSQSDINLVKSSITSKVQLAKSLAEDKILNVIQNLRFRLKSRNEIADKFLDNTLEDDNSSEHSKSHASLKEAENAEFDYLIPRLRQKAQKGTSVSKDEYLDEIRRYLREEGDNQCDYLEANYQLQIIEIRSFRLKILSIMNFFRSVQRKLTLDLFQIQSSNYFKVDPEGSMTSNNSNKNPESKILVFDDEEKNKARYKRPEGRRGFLNVNMMAFRANDVNADVEKELGQVVCRLDKTVYTPSKDYEEEDDFNVPEVFIINDLGENLLYSESRNDLLKLEEEFLKIGTFFIDKFEQTRQIHKAEIQESYLLIDRFKVMLDIYESEARYQFSKMRLVEEYFEIYEHTIDPLEQYKLIYKILDLMCERPGLDFESLYFKDCYNLEINLRKKQTKLIKDLKLRQTDFENAENSYYYDIVEKFIEMSGNFQVYLKKLETLKSDKDENDIRLEEEYKRREKQDQKNAEFKAKDLEDILEEAKGKPNQNKEKDKKKMKDLFQEKNYLMQYFQGGPHAFSSFQGLNVVKYSPFAQNCGLMDFYTSLNFIPKIMVLIDSVIDEFVVTFKEHNKTFLGCLKNAFFNHALKLASEFDYFHKYENIEDNPLIDDAASLEEIVNTTSKNVNGHRISSEYLYHLDLNFVESKLYSKPILSFIYPKEEEKGSGDPYQRHKELFLFCNMVEMQRLREELIYSLHENNVLEKVYKTQRKNVGLDDTWRSIYIDKLPNFLSRGSDEYKINKGDGTGIDMQYKAVREFDDRLKAHMNFASTNCIGTLVLRDQLEELRAITKYEIMNRELLQYEIQRSQVILDYSQHLLMEIDILIKEGNSKSKRANLSSYRVLEPKMDFDRIYAGDVNIVKLKAKVTKDVTEILRRHLRDITDLKRPEREQAEKNYLTFNMHSGSSELEELKAKRLRIFRKDLLNDFCDDIIKKLTLECNKISLINISKKIRQMINVIPDNNTCFRFKSNPFHEADDVLYSEQKKFTEGVLDNESFKSESLIDENFDVKFPFYIYSNLDILTLGDEYLEREAAGFCWKLKNFDAKAYRARQDAVFKPGHEEIEVINPKQETDEYEDPVLMQKKEDWIKHHFKKIAQIKEKSPYRRVVLNMKNTTLYKLTKYYRYLYEFLQERFLNILFEFSNEENTLLLDALYYGKPFPKPRGLDPKKDEIIDKKDANNGGEAEWRSALKEIIEDKETHRHMFVLLSNIKEELNEVYNTIRNPKGLPFDTLLDHIKGEVQFYYKKIPIFLTQAYADIFQKFDIANLLDVGESLKKVYRPADMNLSLGLKFLKINHFAKSKLSSLDTSKSEFNNFSEFENFYSHLKRRKRDEANSKLQMCAKMFRYFFRRQAFLDDKRRWKKMTKLDDDSDYVVKDIRTSSANIFGTSELLLNPDVLKLPSILYQLEASYRSYLGSIIKTKDLHFRNYYGYKSRKKEPSNEREYYQTLFEYTNLLWENENLTLFIQVWNRKEPFSMFYITYQKQMEIIKQNVLKDVDKERGKIRVLQLGKVLLDPPKKFEPLFFMPSKDRDPKQNKRTPQELNLYSDIEMALSHFVAQNICLQTHFERGILNDSVKIFSEEISTLSLLTERFEKDLEVLEAELFRDSKLKEQIKKNQYFSSLLVHNPKVQVTLNNIPDLSIKLGSIQNFINRLRNRALKITTINGEDAFVIKAHDMDECLAKLAKNLIDKNLIDIKNREETAKLKISELNKEIEKKNEEISILTKTLDVFMRDMERLAETKMHEKSNSLIFEMDALLRDFVSVKSMITKLEEKLSKVMEKKYADKIQGYERDIQMIKEKCKNFESDVKVDVKTKIKMIADKLKKHIDTRAAEVLKVSLDEIQVDKEYEKYGENDLNDIIESKKMMNRMRYYWILKFNFYKEKFTKYRRDMEEKLEKAHKNYEDLVEARKREYFIRKELNHIQRSLDYQEKINVELQSKLQELNMDRLRLERFKEVNSKKLEKLEDELREMKFMQNIDVAKLLDNYQRVEAQIEILKRKEANFEDVKKNLEKTSDIKFRMIQKELSQEIQAKNQVLDKVNILNQELTGFKLSQDDPYVTWLEKCKELAQKNKNLELEISRLRERLRYVEGKLYQNLQVSNNINVGTYVQIMNNSPGEGRFDSFENVKEYMESRGNQGEYVRTNSKESEIPLLKTPERKNSQEKRVYMPPLTTIQSSYSPISAKTSAKSATKYYRNGKLNVTEIQNSPDTIKAAIQIAHERSKMLDTPSNKKERGKSSTPVKLKNGGELNQTFY